MDRLSLLLERLQTHPEDRFALYGAALELKKLGQHQEAESHLRALVRHHPTSGAGHYQLGLLLAERDDAAGARRAWQAGLAALEGVTDAEARRSVGEIRGALDDLD